MAAATDKPGNITYLEDRLPVVNMGGGFACILLLCLTAVAMTWIWTAHREELVESQTKVEQMGLRLEEARQNAQNLRAMYRLKFKQDMTARKVPAKVVEP